MSDGNVVSSERQWYKAEVELLHIPEIPFFISAENPKTLLEISQDVEKVFRGFERIGRTRIPRYYVGSKWHEGEYGSIEWYVKKSMDSKRNVVDPTQLLAYCAREPWQRIKPHYEIIILDTDMAGTSTNFLFGSTNPRVSTVSSPYEVNFPDGRGRVYPNTRTYFFIKDRFEVVKEKVANGEKLELVKGATQYEAFGCVVSTYRLKMWYRDEWKLAFRCILAHELGHFYGLPPGERTLYMDISDNHCEKRDCVMEQVNIEGKLDLLEKAKHLRRINGYDGEHTSFCRKCRESLEEFIPKLHEFNYLVNVTYKPAVIEKIGSEEKLILDSLRPTIKRIRNFHLYDIRIKKRKSYI